MADMRTTVDRSGRLVIPLAFRRLLGLAGGGEVELESTGDGLLIRRVAGAASVGTDEEGLPVVHLEGVQTVTNEEVLEALQADRDAR